MFYPPPPLPEADFLVPITVVAGIIAVAGLLIYQTVSFANEPVQDYRALATRHCAERWPGRETQTTQQRDCLVKFPDGWWPESKITKQVQP